MNGRNDNDFPIQITSEVLHKIREQTFSCLPEEACGVFLGNLSERGLRLDDYIAIPNTATDPKLYFSLDPVVWTALLFNEPRICGLYHSHPTSPPLPSIEDLKQLQSFGGLLKVYFIGSPQLSSPGDYQLRAYQIIPDQRRAPERNGQQWTLSQKDYVILRSV
ncbi:Mov34/MPN/PAD-1 family protein [Paenibacillus faecalis]|uniref:Mov34/MPN/PAD-1 family protein n=1 Tax=Paenibacillus faecalis TaxID=2079532 RepID=UPI00131A4AEC|nr:Mov34/MPN/PAD-1 family protein [Paenibacillus faecalis]